MWGGGTAGHWPHVLFWEYPRSLVPGLFWGQGGVGAGRVVEGIGSFILWSQVLSWGYFSQVTGQGYPLASPPPTRTRTGVTPRPGTGQGVPPGQDQDQDRGYLPPSQTSHTTDRIRLGWYASCAHVGGLSCISSDEALEYA